MMNFTESTNYVFGVTNNYKKGRKKKFETCRRSTDLPALAT